MSGLDQSPAGGGKGHKRGENHGMNEGPKDGRPPPPDDSM